MSLDGNRALIHRLWGRAIDDRDPSIVDVAHAGASVPADPLGPAKRRQPAGDLGRQTQNERRSDMNDELLAMVEREVLAWPGVTAERRGSDVTVFWVGRRQVGHIHHDGVADLQFPRAVHDELIAAGRAEPHRGGFAAVVSYYLRERDDVPRVVDLFRLSFDRVQAATGIASAVSPGGHRRDAP